MTLTAVPGKNTLFSNWVGGASSSSSSIVVTLATNLAVQANFATNPFLAFAAAGAYQGLFQETNSGQVRLDRSGGVSASLTTLGAYTGKLTITNKTYSFSGHFDVAGLATNSVTLGKTESLTAWLRLDSQSGALTGLLSNANWTGELAACHTGRFPKTNAGAYTLLIPGSDDSSALPGGESFAALTVGATGQITVKGTLADGTAFTPTASISQTGRWPLYVSLYSGKGALFGWLTFTNDADSDLSGEVSWIKLGQKATYYGNGFTNRAVAVGARYKSSVPATGFTNGLLTVAEGGLTNSFTVSLSIGAGNKIVSGNKSLKLTLTTATGLFQGTVSNSIPGSLPKTLSIRGAVLAKQTNAAGFFLGASQSGRVTLERAQ